jgi:hypothetical protein
MNQMNQRVGAGTAALDPDAEVIARRVGVVLFHSRAAPNGRNRA